MTTENKPAGTPAAQDENGQRPRESDSSLSEQAPPEDSGEATVAEEPPKPNAGVTGAPMTEAPVAETRMMPPAADSAIDSPGDARASQTETSTDTSAADESPPAAETASPSASTSSAPESPAPPRRVRLNPTVDPDALKPIPSLRPAEPPLSVSAPSESTAQAIAEKAAPPAESADTESSDTASSADIEAAREESVTSDDTESAAQAAGTESTVPAPPRPEPVAIPSKHESLDADLEAELEAALTGSEQNSESAAQVGEAAAEASAAAAVPSAELDVKRGTRLKGIVQSIHGDDMFLEFGLRMAGVLSRRQFGLRKQPMQGEPLEVVVHRVDEKEGLIHVNLPTGTSKVRGDWDALTVDQNVECMVNGTNKGGLEVTVGSLRGFMPASQVELGYVPDLNVYIGQKLKARIAEVNPKRRKLVLSRRSLLEEEREQSQQELFEKVQPGQQYTGRVKTIKDYGAFVDIGGADGLLHVAQISWTRINHPSEVLKEGEEIDVQVLSVDKDKKKISLGMRQLTQNPWKAAESKYAQGTQVRGKVTRIENFGAFVELEEGVEGLVHISELDHKRVKQVTEVLRVGQEVDVQVLDVDPKRKRVGLSVKALKEKPDEPEASSASSPIKRQRSVDSLVGGIGEPTGGQLFGDPSKFGG